uniref:TorF family putative porin n=1 Tax=Castellaniella defragrans TaxID=75697 RepID=UPI00333F704C
MPFPLVGNYLNVIGKAPARVWQALEIDRRFMDMKAIYSFAALVGALAFVMPMTSSAELSFNIGVVSLYKDRGVDQEGRDEGVRPAVQGGVDYDFGNGLYVGNWNSSGRFGNADAEVDLYAGYRFQVTNDVGLDVGYVHYYYPGEGAWNSGEAYVGLGYQRLSLKIYRGMRRDVNDGDMYYRLTYMHPIIDKLDFKVGLGYQHFHASDLHGKVDYSVGLSYAIGKYVSLSGDVSGANRRNDVDDGSRDTRFILGLNAAF